MLVEDLQVLAMTEEVASLVEAYDQHLGLSGRARADLPHFAFAVAYKIDDPVIWNCMHIANGEVIRRLREANEKLQRFTPIILTPKELLPASQEET